jgi:hypothetical protein
MNKVRPVRCVVSGLLLAAPLAVTFALAPGAVASASSARSEQPALGANADCVTVTLGGQLKLPECLGD